MEHAGSARGVWEEAKTVFREVVEIRERQDDATAFELAHAYIGEAIVERTVGDNGKALQSLAKAGRHLVFVPGGNDYLRAWMLGMQATINWQQKKNEIAYKQTEELLKLLREMLGEQHPAVAYIRIDFAWRIYGAGEYQKSEAYYREGIALARQSYGRQPRTAYVLHKFGSMLAKQTDRCDEARACAKQSLGKGNEM